MQIRGRELIREFTKEYPMAKKPLKRWEAAVQLFEWRTPADVKQVCGSVSFIGKTTVFNIGGNKWRLLSHIMYEEQIVLITSILTHVEYDKVKIE